MKNFIDCLVRSAPLSIVIIGIGYVLTHLIFGVEKLDFILFVLGAIPIVIFLPTVLSQSRSGALHTPKVIFRKVDSLERKGRKETENIFPALTYVLSGVLTWLYSLLIY